MDSRVGAQTVPEEIHVDTVHAWVVISPSFEMTPSKLFRHQKYLC